MYMDHKKLIASHHLHQVGNLSVGQNFHPSVASYPKHNLYILDRHLQPIPIDVLIVLQFLEQIGKKQHDYY